MPIRSSNLELNLKSNLSKFRTNRYTIRLFYIRNLIVKNISEIFSKYSQNLLKLKKN